jgi:hypothetical protein
MMAHDRAVGATVQRTSLVRALIDLAAWLGRTFAGGPFPLVERWSPR